MFTSVGEKDLLSKIVESQIDKAIFSVKYCREVNSHLKRSFVFNIKVRRTEVQCLCCCF
jgi:hypothetical protein